MGGRKLPDQWILGIVTWCKRDEKIQDILWNFSSCQIGQSTNAISAGFSSTKKEYENTGAKQNLSWQLILQDKMR